MIRINSMDISYLDYVFLSQHIQVVQAGHEFVAVIILLGAFAKLGFLFTTLFKGTWIIRYVPKGLFFPAVDIARATALQILAGGRAEDIETDILNPRLRARALRISRWSSLRRKHELDARAHAPLWAALSLADMLNPDQEIAFRAESTHHLVGVPDSEPTWVRLLDGMLAALALQKLGNDLCVRRWQTTCNTLLALHNGRRPAAVHTPSMLSFGTARTWEHAASSALAFKEGWIGDEDWKFLRPRCLGAAAGSSKAPETLRLIAAGKFWAALMKDDHALGILNRRQTGGDIISNALTECANSVLRRGVLVKPELGRR